MYISSICKCIYKYGISSIIYSIYKLHVCTCFHTLFCFPGESNHQQRFQHSNDLPNDSRWCEKNVREEFRGNKNEHTHVKWIRLMCKDRLFLSMVKYTIKSLLPWRDVLWIEIKYESLKKFWSRSGYLRNGLSWLK